MLSAGLTALSVNGYQQYISPVVSCGSLSNTNAAASAEITITAAVSSVLLFLFYGHIFLGSFVNVQHAVNTPRKLPVNTGYTVNYLCSTVEVSRNGFIFSNFIKSDRSETNFYKSSNKLLCHLLQHPQIIFAISRTPSFINGFANS